MSKTKQEIGLDKIVLRRAFKSNRLSNEQIETLERCEEWTWESQGKGRKRWTHETFVNAIKEKNSDLEILDQFATTKKSILVRCKKCENKWEIIAGTLLRNPTCPYCREGANPWTTESFKKEIENHNPNIELLGDYKIVDSKVLFHCKACGHTWEQKPRNLLSTGFKCPSCAYEDRTLKRINSANPNIEVLDKFYHSTDRIKAKCRICGYEWETKPGNLVTPTNCSQCSSRRTAKPVRNKDTGEIFPSLKAASRSVGRKGKSGLPIAIAMNHRYGGYYWEYITDTDEF